MPVNKLDSGSRSLGSRPGRVNVLCSWAKLFTLSPSRSSSEQSGKPNEVRWIDKGEGGGGGGGGGEGAGGSNITAIIPTG